MLNASHGVRLRFVRPHFLAQDRRHFDLKMIKKHNKKGRGQADNRSASRRNDARSILRSRTVQGVLVMAAGLQGATAVAKHEMADLSVTASSPAALVAMPLQPMLVARQESAPAGEAKEQKAGAAEGVKTDEQAKVQALATKYRKKGYNVPQSLAEAIHSAAVEAGIAPEVAFGLVRTESAFKSSATSHVGAIGLTQLMPSTARWLEPGTTRSDLRDPETNVRIGLRYLARLIDRYDGDTRLALTAYNRGPGTVDRVLRRGGDPDNGYADMVLGK
jgi:soluble lytic murein transglycosylase-like protein